MALQQIKVPHIRGYDFGIGVDRVSGSVMNQVVKPTPSPPSPGIGTEQSFDVSRIYSTRDLQQQLNIDIEASYGCATFGAGASGRFSYMQTSAVHSSALFMTVTALVKQADLSIDLCELTETAKLVSDVNLFAARYGDMFCRSCSRGGLFVGVMRIETHSEAEANDIEFELRGSYGFFSADAANKFSTVTSSHQTSVYCRLHAEGGPALSINDPNDPKELLRNANNWMQAMHDNPEHNSVPYEWTLSPVAIAEGLALANEADIQHGQDVLQFCARARTSILDQLNLLSWIHDHPDRFEWTGPVTLEQVTAAMRATQDDFDQVARCASHAIENPKGALLPAAFAASHGEQYPTAIMPVPLPKPSPLPARPEEFYVPNLIGQNWNDVRSAPAYAQDREHFNLQSMWSLQIVPAAEFYLIVSMDPPPGTGPFPKGYTVTCTYNPPSGFGPGSARNP